MLSTNTVNWYLKQKNTSVIKKEILVIPLTIIYRNDIWMLTADDILIHKNLSAKKFDLRLKIR